MKTTKRKNNIRLLALDIDDTLVHRAGRVSERNLAAVEAARRAGVYVTLATGRGYLGSSRVVRELGLDTLIVNYGGAIITDAKTGEPVYTTELENEYLQEVLALADERGVHAHIYLGDRIIYEKPHPYARLYTDALSLPYTIDPEVRRREWHGVPKALIITEPERVAELLAFFEAHFSGRVAVSASSPGFIEFNKLGANKGTAVARIAQGLGIDRSEVAAIGDNTLDRELLEFAGLSAAVENANEVIKAIADVIVPACTEDGAAYFIENHILK